MMSYMLTRKCRGFFPPVGLVLFFACVISLSGCGSHLQTFQFASASMEPTFSRGQTVIVSDVPRSTFSRGDVILFTMPLPAVGIDVKRIIALPGDTLQIHNGVVKVNGRRIPEPYIRVRTPYDVIIRGYKIYVSGKPLALAVANIPNKAKWTHPDRLPPGCYFVLGDNRRSSFDSHDFGCAYDRVPFSSGMLAGHMPRAFGTVIARAP